MIEVIGLLLLSLVWFMLGVVASPYILPRLTTWLATLDWMRKDEP